jgi:uncharacterized protein (TIGR02145 family)
MMNKKIFTIAVVSIITIGLFTSCEKDDELILPDDITRGVEINGVRWATRNVDAPGTFTANPQSAGMFYQWNRATGWSAINPMINSNGDNVWDNSAPTGNEWENANDPCPQGWRVPTSAELQSLTNAKQKWATVGSVNGMLFGTAPNLIFLPAAGYRNSEGDGLLTHNGSYGYYWSNTQGNNWMSWSLMHFDDANADMYYSVKADGLSVRCVAE